MKTIFIYTVLVGIMFAGILEILHIGEKIKAPIDVNGNWIVYNDNSEGFSSDSLPINLPKKNAEISIEQSGKHLVLTFNDANKSELNGKLEKNRMFFSRIYPVSPSLKLSCGSSTKVEVILDIDQYKDKPEQLSGIFRMPDCKIFEEIHFNAIKKL